MSQLEGGGGLSFPFHYLPGHWRFFLGGIKHFYVGPNLWTLKLSALSLPLKEHSLMQKKVFFRVLVNRRIRYVILVQPRRWLHEVVTIVRRIEKGKHLSVLCGKTMSCLPKAFLSVREIPFFTPIASLFPLDLTSCHHRRFLPPPPPPLPPNPRNKKETWSSSHLSPHTIFYEISICLTQQDQVLEKSSVCLSFPLPHLW